MIAIDLFCGLGGWAEGFLAEGYEVIGFDIERHDYGMGGYPGQLVLQDVLTLHGSQFRNATCIVASPPCQKYSYMAMPWKRAKTEIAWQKWSRDSGSRLADPFTLNALFDACFRIQREASEAAGRHIPMVVENVKGAQPWVGPARWHYGSYYLWGDVPALMPFAMGRKVPMNFHEHEKTGKPGRSFQSAAVEHIKNGGGSWFNVAHNNESGVGQNPVSGSKCTCPPACDCEDPDGNPRLISNECPEHNEMPDIAPNCPADSHKNGAIDWNAGGRKIAGYSDPRRNGGRGVHLTSQRENSAGIKQAGHSGRAWFADPDVAGHFSSKSDSRKAASAQIAKIPFPLANHIARVFASPVSLEASRLIW